MQQLVGKRSAWTHSRPASASAPALAPRTVRRGKGRAPLPPRAAGGGTGGGRGGPTGLDVQGHRPTSPAGWELMKQALQEAGVKMVAPQEVVFVSEAGTHTIVDVRPEDLFGAGRVPGAVNVPYYRPIDGWSPWQIARRIGYATFGVFNGTEVNPEFGVQVEAAVNGDLSRPVVLYCSQGGSMEPTPALKRGFQTRSLVAAYELVQRGFTSVSVMKGGFFDWQSAGREVEGAAAEEEGAAPA